MDTNALDSIRRVALTLAGDTFTWEHPNAPKQLNSAHRRGLTILLARAQNNVCAACGDPLDGAIEIAHLVASRIAGRGVMPGNVYVGHKGCNDDDSKVYGDVVPLTSLVRADLVPTAFPTRQACVLAASEADKVRADRRARREAIA